MGSHESRAPQVTNCWECGATEGEVGWRGLPVWNGKEWCHPHHKNHDGFACPSGNLPIKSHQRQLAGNKLFHQQNHAHYLARQREQLRLEPHDGNPESPEELSFWEKCLLAILASPRAASMTSSEIFTESRSYVVDRRAVVAAGQKRGTAK